MGGWRRQGKGAGEGGKGREGKGGESERGKGQAGEAGSSAGAERRPHWAPGSRRLLTIPGRRAAGRLLLSLSQALGPWGSHARSGCRLCLPRRSASPPPPPCLRPGGGGRPLPRSAAPLQPPPPLPAPPGLQQGPGSSHTRLRGARSHPPGSGCRILPPPRRFPPAPPSRGAAPLRSAPFLAVWRGSVEGFAFCASLPSSASPRRPWSFPQNAGTALTGLARRPPPPPTRQAGPWPRGRRFRAPGAA